MRIDFHRIPEMARATGLEPAASGVTGRRSNQLSYARIGQIEARGVPAFAGPVKGCEKEIVSVPRGRETKSRGRQLTPRTIPSR
jgi:hypothetical protein